MDRRDTQRRLVKVDSSAPEDFHDVRLQHNAPAATVQVVSRPFEDIDVPTDVTEQISGEQAAEKAAKDQSTRACLRCEWGNRLFGHESISFSMA
ncbi:hypothetical protein D3C86_1337410 [compost metagenome]